MLQLQRLAGPRRSTSTSKRTQPQWQPPCRRSARAEVSLLDPEVAGSVMGGSFRLGKWGSEYLSSRTISVLNRCQIVPELAGSYPGAFMGPGRCRNRPRDLDSARSWGVEARCLAVGLVPGRLRRYPRYRGSLAGHGGELSGRWLRRVPRGGLH